MKKTITLGIAIHALIGKGIAQEKAIVPIPSEKPSKHQQEQIDRKYGMFIHFGINWSIGLPENVDKHPVLPDEQKDYYPIRYFPSDFRLGDPYLPSDSDPKLFVAQGNVYYMPFETTVVLGERWFFNTNDKKYKSLDELENTYHKATSQDNILILNVGPNRDGRIKDTDVDILLKLRERIAL